MYSGILYAGRGVRNLDFRRRSSSHIFMYSRLHTARIFRESRSSRYFKIMAAGSLGCCLVGLALSGDFRKIKNYAYCQLNPVSAQIKVDSSYDFVVVGAGVAGISSIFGILRIRPGSRILVVDQNPASLRDTLEDPVPEIESLQGQYGRVSQLPHVQVVTGVAATRLDPETRTIALQGGASVQYKHGCLLATGREVLPIKKAASSSDSERERRYHGG